PVGGDRSAQRARSAHGGRARLVRAARRLRAQRRSARLQRHPLAGSRRFPVPGKQANGAPMSDTPDTQTLYAAFATKIDAALAALEKEALLPAHAPRGAVSVEPPRDPAHGDLATNAAMVLAKLASTNPRALAGHIVEKLADDPLIESAEI